MQTNIQPNTIRGAVPTNTDGPTQFEKPTQTENKGHCIKPATMTIAGYDWSVVLSFVEAVVNGRGSRYTPHFVGWWDNRLGWPGQQLGSIEVKPAWSPFGRGVAVL